MTIYCIQGGRHVSNMCPPSVRHEIHQSGLSLHNMAILKPQIPQRLPVTSKQKRMLIIHHMHVASLAYPLTMSYILPSARVNTQTMATLFETWLTCKVK